ncbi:MAG: leucine-rich repeat domain-containing protein [Candidatus Saccharimonadales bacterium]
MRTTFVRFSYLAAVFSIAGLFQMYNAPISAAAPNPDSCFTTSGTTSKTIVAYNVNGTGCGVILEIPSTIGGGSVVAIGENAFDYKSLTSVTIPNSVTSIGTRAFERNSLTSLTIPSSVTSIDTRAFGSNQLTSVVFNGTVASLSSDILYGNVLTSITYNGTTYTDNIPLVDACFSFSAGTINAYYQFDMGLIKNSGIACMKRAGAIPTNFGGVPVTSIGTAAYYDKQLTSAIIPNTVTTIGQTAFRFNQLTSIDIPNTVVSIGYGAFSYNQLSSAVLPDSLTIVDDFLFSYNRLTSVTLGDAVTAIGYGAFYANNLESITVPDTLTTIEDWAFVLQSANDSLQLEIDYYSNIPAVSKAALDSMWFVKMYTKDPSNPSSLKDKLFYEDLDLDSDNDYDDPAYMGGHLINPASATFSFTDPQDGQLQPSQTYTGKLDDGTDLTNYFVTQGPVLPTFANPYNLTPQDIQTIQDTLSVYYRIGDTFTYAAPTINGVAPTPTSYSFVLGASTGINDRQFVYGTAASNPLTQATGQLANTGVSLWFIIAAASIVIIGSAGILARR